LAGNLLIVGSIANIIVVDSATPHDMMRSAPSDEMQ
jgi:Na+/H+ antiporter NhaD/arsenite permease-like protein